MLVHVSFHCVNRVAAELRPLGGIYTMESKQTPIVFTPDNEPYLGRTLLFQFDQLISSLLEQNLDTAPATHKDKLSDHQKMACLVIPQAISISLSIRELIRQGYLFGAHVLLRAVVERAAILLYLHYCPNEIDKWNKGWNYQDAPSLAKMFEAIQVKQGKSPTIPGHELTKSMNSLLHSKPNSGPWNITGLERGEYGYASSKILNRPKLCDDLCGNIIPWIVIVQSMMAAYFPKENAT